ncbi:MAG: hypothetical protein J7641_24015 [Cyanobacteria bacterium SID2]|nr:hypothetical protein [Cyanobacteria bacterium SID2]MBP0003572.1 hypothetical protein [Cyanobacteria bacterium SBC]
MKPLFFKRVMWGVSIAIAAAIAMPLSAHAQTSTYNEAIPNDPFDDSANQGDRSQLEGEGGLNVFDIIHRATSGPEMSFDEFVSGQDSELNNAAEDFRARQLERLRQQEAASPELTDTSEAP